MDATRGIAVLICAALAAASCARTPSPPAPRARHLVLVTIDTLRAYRLACYGNGSPSRCLTSIGLPGKRALALDATAHAPLTRPSHVSLFTGLHPTQHGVRDNISPSLAEDLPTLAEVLQKNGFRQPPS